MKTLYAWISKIEAGVAMFGLAFCVIVLFLGALSRQMGHPIRFANDFAMWGFSWCIFIGADVAFKKPQGLFYVDAVIGNVPWKVARVMHLVLNLIVAVFLTLVVVYGIQLCIRSWTRPLPSIPTISYSWLTMSVPIGGALMFITNIIKIKELSFMWRNGPAREEASGEISTSA